MHTHTPNTNARESDVVNTELWEGGVQGSMRSDGINRIHLGDGESILLKILWNK